VSKVRTKTDRLRERERERERESVDTTVRQCRHSSATTSIDYSISTVYSVLDAGSPSDLY